MSKRSNNALYSRRLDLQGSLRHLSRIYYDTDYISMLREMVNRNEDINPFISIIWKDIIFTDKKEHRYAPMLLSRMANFYRELQFGDSYEWNHQLEDKKRGEKGNS